MKFNRYTLGELVSIKYGKNQKNVLSESGTYPIYGTGGLMGYATEPLYTKPSVLIGRKGTIDKVKFVDHPFWTVDTLFYTIVNEDIVIPKYLYYRMSMMDLSAYNEGTTIPSLRTETLNRLEFDIPSIEEQQKILSYLEPIDDKIALNREINNNLLEQASVLFQEICVDGASLDWTEGVLGDIADITSGKRPPMRSDNMTDEARIPLVGAASIMGYTSEANHSDKILVTGRVGTHGVVQRFNYPCWTSDNTLIITSPHYEFVYQILQRVDYKAMNRGSTQPLITQGDLKKVTILIPDTETLQRFESLVGALMNRYESNIFENEKLAETRNALLPKLMSGELDVSAVEI